MEPSTAAARIREAHTAMGVQRGRSPFRRFGAAFLPLASVLVAVGLATVLTMQSNDAAPPRRLPPLKPFLEEFRQLSIPRVSANDVEWQTAGGVQTGYLARALVQERLPAVLLLSDKRGLGDWLKQSARELASVGYVVLAIDMKRLSGGVLPASKLQESTPSMERRREQILSRLTAAVRWLQRKPYVDAERSAVIGFSAGAGWALAVASDQKLQACVTVDGPLSNTPVLLSGLRHTAILTIWSGQHARAVGQKNIDFFRRTLAARRIESESLLLKQARIGFLDPSQKSAHRFADAERVWVVLYEFLGTHVEDAPVKDLLVAKTPSVTALNGGKARISDLMLAVNSPAGVRGQLLEMLKKPPIDARVWREVRARAAVMVETASLLEKLAPRRGTRADWWKQVNAYRVAASELLEAANQQNAKTAQPALGRLSRTCTDCHRAHR